jgi:XTP/dITP diphosphohydrolase
MILAKEKQMSYILVTGNIHKWNEAQRILGHPLERISLELPEVQAATTKEVALIKAKAAYEILGRPVIVEDAGLEFAALGGFPGPFIKYWESLGGLPSLCRALDGFDTRGARAVCVLARADEAGVRAFEGFVNGSIAANPRGQNGFGWDSVFIPENQTRTYAEMSADEKNGFSHRLRAWSLLRTEMELAEASK